jgi:hypothetical protein
LILQLPLLLENNGQGLFQDVGPEVSDYFSIKRSGRAAAVWDYDNAGDMDIIVSHIDLHSTPTLLRNDGGNDNHWLGLKLFGKEGPASAIGARITIRSGDMVQVHVNQWATSYLSNHDPRVHIGLGENKMVDQLEISWSNGKKEIYYNLKVDCYMTILEGTATQ